MQIYIAAPLNADTSIVRKVLMSREDSILDSSSLSILESISLSPQESMFDFWKQVDAVVAIPQLSGGELSDSVLIEIGVAIGQRIPLIVLTEDSHLAEKLEKQGAFVVRASLYAEDALRSHLRLFLADAQSPSRVTEIQPRKPANTLSRTVAENRLEQIKSMRGIQRYTAFEHWVGDVLRSSGVVVQSNSREDRGFDFVLSLSHSQVISGPILVEVKTANRSHEVEKAAILLQGSVIRERAALGLLLYFDKVDKNHTLPLSLPNVVILGVHKMVELLSNEYSLETILVSARNEAVHKL